MDLSFQRCHIDLQDASDMGLSNHKNQHGLAVAVNQGDLHSI